MNVPRPSWRKPAGMLIILGLIAVLAFTVTTVIEAVGGLSPIAAIPVYAIAGILWIAPLRPLLQWMETGRWRRPEN